ncbi:MAG TPA: hypothetical protein VFN26_00860 [Candidatus Acidoferrum sp.]|nr:hypothetical protein [Candidatus Acidoferrum sp.]
MRTFEVFLNEQRLCVAGITGDGVMSIILDSVTGPNRDELFLRVGGLQGSTKEHVRWQERELKVGDNVRIRVAEAESFDPPTRAFRSDPAKDLQGQKNYVRAMAKKLGWRLMTRNVKTRRKKG